MVCPKKIIKVGRKCQKIAAVGSKAIFTKSTSGKGINSDSSNAVPVADKGHFVVYTIDRRRFAMPLSYLSNNILLELFRMSEEEFGLSNDGPITLPCDAVFMDYIVSLVQRGVAESQERALIKFITSASSSLSSTSLCQADAGQHQTFVYGC